jgi:hypothetical protein
LVLRQTLESYPQQSFIEMCCLTHLLIVRPVQLCGHFLLNQSLTIFLYHNLSYFWGEWIHGQELGEVQYFLVSVRISLLPFRNTKHNTF